MANIIMKLEEPIVAVREAPILRRPITQDKEPMNGIKENKSKIIIFLCIDNNSICENDFSEYGIVVVNIVSYSNGKIIHNTRMRPATNIDAPAT